MQFTVEQTDLASGLHKVSRAVSGRTPLPVLSGILIEAVDGHLTLSATDLDITIRTQVPAQVKNRGAIVLPARYLSEYVRRIPGGTISFQVDESGQSAILQWQRSQYQINGFLADQFPDLPPIDGQRQLKFPQPLLRNIIQQTSFAVSTDETRAILTGVYININADRLEAIATDGFRVAIRHAQLPHAGEPVKMILPGRALQELVRLLDASSDEEVSLSVASNHVHADMGHAVVTSRLIDGQYPNVMDLLPSDYPTRVRLERLALLQAAERAALMSDSRQTARLIILHVQPEQLVITSHDPEVGQAHEEVPAELDGEGLQIGINARYLSDGLLHIDGDEVWMEFIDPVKAIRIRACDDDSYQYIAFPVRL